MIPRTNAGDVQLWTVNHDGSVHVAPLTDDNPTGPPQHGGRANVGQVRAELHTALFLHSPACSWASDRASLSFIVEHGFPAPTITWAGGDELRGEAYGAACRIMAEAIANARRIAS